MTKKSRVKEKKLRKFFVIFSLSLLFLFSIFIIIQGEYNATTTSLAPPSTGKVALSGESLQETIEFEPYLYKTFKYKIISSPEKAMNYKINIRGNIAKYFESSIDQFFLEAGKSRDLIVEMNLPRELIPNLYTTYICVQETESFEKQEEDLFSVKTEVCAIINVLVLNEGAYIKIEEITIKQKENKETEFTLILTNFGKEDIKSAKAQIYIYRTNETGEIGVIAITITEKKSILSTEQEIFSSNYFLEDGKYNADIIIEYDGQTKNTKEEFIVGEALRIIDYTTEFKNENENSFKVILENNYDYELESYIEINISQDGEKVQIVRTNKELIQSREIKTIDVPFYVYSPGEYDIEMKIYFQNKVIIEKGKIKINLKTEIPGSSDYNAVYWLARIIGVIAILLFILFFIKELRKRKKSIIIKKIRR